MLKSVTTALLAASLIVAGLFAGARAGLLVPLGIDSTTSDSQVVQAIERTQEVALVSLNIQGITQEKRNTKVFGVAVPGSSEKVLLLYTFDAKLGIDGTRVRVTREGENAYLVSIPEFIFIGYDEPVFEEVANDGGVLRILTDDIDRTELINKVLNGGAKDSYLESNFEVLEDQTRVFYETLVKGVDPGASVTFEFSSE